MTGISTSGPVRIAMWSGPRNISTAMMRSWEARGDCAVCDEPLYAHYLVQTRLDHPIADEIIRHHETDWRVVVDGLLGPVPNGKPIYYQKHMTHHILPQIQYQWVDQVVNCFLIREPREMITSLIKVLPDPTLEETGLPQQVQLFDHVRERTGSVPPVLDARDVLEDPGPALEQLCASVGVPFTDRMLRWPPGRRATDGIWAHHWYAAVEKSTGFAPYRPKSEPVPDRLADLLSECEQLYARLYEHRLT